MLGDRGCLLGDLSLDGIACFGRWAEVFGLYGGSGLCKRFGLGWFLHRQIIGHGLLLHGRLGGDRGLAQLDATPQHGGGRLGGWGGGRRLALGDGGLLGERPQVTLRTHFVIGPGLLVRFVGMLIGGHERAGGVSFLNDAAARTFLGGDFEHFAGGWLLKWCLGIWVALVKSEMSGTLRALLPTHRHP